MKLSYKQIKEVRKYIDKGKSVKAIASKFDFEIKAVNKIYREYLQEQISNNPRAILAKKIYQIQKACDQAIKNYEGNSRPEYAYAISSLGNELRASIQDLQGLVDVTTLSNLFLDEVLYPNMIDGLQMFIKELGSARDEMGMLLNEAEARQVNEVLLDLIKGMKGKLNDLKLKGVQRLEKSLQIDLEDRRNEVLALPDSTEAKNKKFKVIQKAG